MQCSNALQTLMCQFNFFPDYFFIALKGKSISSVHLQCLLYFYYNDLSNFWTEIKGLFLVFLKDVVMEFEFSFRKRVTMLHAAASRTLM